MKSSKDKMAVMNVDLDDIMRSDTTEKTKMEDLNPGDKVLLKVGSHVRGSYVTDWKWFQGYIASLPDTSSRKIALSPYENASMRKISSLNARFNIDYFHTPFCAEVRRYK